MRVFRQYRASLFCILTLSSSCAEAQRLECLSLGQAKAEEANGDDGKSAFEVIFDELNTTDNERNTFLKKAFANADVGTIESCQYGWITRANDIAKLKPQATPDICRVWPYRIKVGFSPHTRSKWSDFTKRMCQLEIPGAIEVTRFSLYREVPWRPGVVYQAPKWDDGLKKD